MSNEKQYRKDLIRNFKREYTQKDAEEWAAVRGAGGLAARPGLRRQRAVHPLRVRRPRVSRGQPQHHTAGVAARRRPSPR